MSITKVSSVRSKLLLFEVAINEALKIIYILEFKRSTDRDDGFLEVKDAKVNEQHKSIIGALKVAALEWEFEQINFVSG